jgi:hypothetical protein
MNTEFLDEEWFTTRALAIRYHVSYQTMKAWVMSGRFSHPDKITVYKLPGDKVTRITQSGVDYFNEHIEKIRGTA